MTYLCLNKTLLAFRSVLNITVGYTLEPLPPALYAKYAHPNPYGLNGRNESLVIGLFTASWKNAADDEQVENASLALVEAIEIGAREQEANVSFVCLNYAVPWQDPIASYGDDNLEKNARDCK
ncbi:hypothetical protein PFICI_02722 [Pestalotiopsis fici W106-1]|uniref:Uncharacterized protein n=1 Tax=Pestalotiopsis fici (strain W106-1 / CGMCC3.15140) TaxID=1229662 RepID=W3XGY1_PESFW|nr:uncharacterized protein PFICI_02722 [Pestalotiopsis fici W106-1]ETS84697.1 hypothetical protein PFICI_02722 [Pestalotiopsis fici W106-1]